MFNLKNFKRFCAFIPITVIILQIKKAYFITRCNPILTHFRPKFQFYYTLWKHPKTLARNVLTNPTTLLVKFNYSANSWTAGFFCVNIVEKNEWGTELKQEAATSVLQKKLFLKISQYSQEITCVGVSFYKILSLPIITWKKNIHRSKMHQKQTHWRKRFYAVASFAGFWVVSFQRE